MIFPIGRHETVIIILERAHENDTARVFVAKERNRFIDSLLQIPKAHDISKSLNAIQNAIRAAERLNEPVHFQILVDPKRIQSRRIKTREKHIHDNQKVDFFILHAERHIAVIIRKFIARRIVICPEHLIVIANRFLQKFAALPRFLIPFLKYSC